MDSSLKVALIAACGAIIGGLITAIVGPKILWNIEKQKQARANQIEQIAKWRKMIAEVAQQRGSSGVLMELLERREEFHSLKGHLSQNVIGELYRPHTVVVGSTIDAGLNYLADEVTRLEKEWELVKS